MELEAVIFWARLGGFPMQRPLVDQNFPELPVPISRTDPRASAKKNAAGECVVVYRNDRLAVPVSNVGLMNVRMGFGRSAIGIDVNACRQSPSLD